MSPPPARKPAPDRAPDRAPNRAAEPVLTVLDRRPLRRLVVLDPIRMIDGRLHLLLGDGIVCPVRYSDPTGLHPGWTATALYVGCDHLLWLSLLHEEGHQADWFLTEHATFLADRVEDVPGPTLDILLNHVRDLLAMPPGPTHDEALQALSHMHPGTREVIQSLIAAREIQSSRPPGAAEQGEPRIAAQETRPDTADLEFSPAPLTMPARPGPLTPAARMGGAELLQPGVLGGIWREAGNRIVVEAGHQVSVTLAVPYRPVHARVSFDISGTDRSFRLTIAIRGWTIGTTRVGFEKASGSRLDYWIPAEALDGETVTIDLVTPQAGTEVAAFIINHVAFDVGPAVPDITPPANDAALMAMFESLGENCEFGFVQRHFGAEPLGLFRFSGTGDLRNTLRLLDSDFAGLGDPGSLSAFLIDALLYRLPDPPLVIPEFMMRDMTLDFWFHTFRGPEYDTEDVSRANNEQKLRYLVRKFREDLEDGEKIWLLKDSVRGDLNEAFAFLDVLSRRGPNKLFWITRTVEGRPSGAVEWVAPNLLRGYSGGPHYDAQIFEPDTWQRLCKNAARAFAERAAIGIA
ncbi:hypothetical protein [Lichenicola sp.]|uniref:hypothetical protein n=1 Tax=Lichenicola sp. TaxID=2804529 RepID=UPI003B008206